MGARRTAVRRLGVRRARFRAVARRRADRHAEGRALYVRGRARLGARGHAARSIHAGPPRCADRPVRARRPRQRGTGRRARRAERRAARGRLGLPREARRISPRARAARLGAEVDSAICARDDLPGAGEPLAVSNTRNVASIPLAAKLPFLFGDRTAPAAPAAPTVTRSGQLATLTWPSGREVDLAGYDVYRTVAGSPPQKLDTVALVGRTTLFDTASPPGSTYTLVAVDTSGNRSAASPASAPSS
jgi:hypothetical protein